VFSLVWATRTARVPFKLQKLQAATKLFLTTKSRQTHSGQIRPDL